MSRTIKAIMRHMILSVRSQPRRVELGPRSKVPRVGLGLQCRASKLVGEWQQRGPETVSGHALRKLRLAFAPTQSLKTAAAAN
jgi:hypothetical protein